MDAYQLAGQYIRNTNRCLFITGKAGTGKTTFLRSLQMQTSKRMAVVAPTGVAAINAEGVTIHSFFQLPPQVFLPTPSARRTLFAEMQMRGQKRKVIHNLELLVIDEISMVRSDLLDTVDAVLRHFKHQPDLPFGGVQVLFIGDLFQLSPVVRDDDWQMLREYYAGPYFFQSRVMQTLNPVYIEFDHIFRQHDSHFIAILNQVRNNCLTAENRQRLNACYQKDFQNDDTDYHIILSTHNYKVDQVNQRELDRIAEPSYTYKAVVTGTFPESAYPMDRELTLKAGARVMFTRNDIRPEKQFYNGKLGIVTKLEDEHVWVDCGDGETIDVPAMTWENVHYITANESDEIKTEIVGTFSHFPLRLAWAVTIHKAQGLTFDHVVIDAADAFACGQIYVALSRCRTLEGIVLLNPIPDNALTNDAAVLAFTDSQPAIDEVQNRYQGAAKDYWIALCCSLFDFRPALQQLAAMRTFVAKHPSYSDAVAQFLLQLQPVLENLTGVGGRFQEQLRKILSAAVPDDAFLKARLQAAADYFSPRLQDILTRWQQAPVTTGNRADARFFDALAEEFLQDLERKRIIMNAIPADPAIDCYFRARAGFNPADVHFSSWGNEQMLNTAGCPHPLLLKALRQLRKLRADDYGLPAFQLASNAILLDIAGRLPQTKQELRKIKGFGSKKYLLWGDDILQTVFSYMAEQGILPKHPAKTKKTQY